MKGGGRDFEDSKIRVLAEDLLKCDFLFHL
jgi:hypothetical protein